jgi:hypothetical protein
VPLLDVQDSRIVLPKSFTAKDRKDAKEENSLTAKAAKDAKKRIIKTKTPRTPRQRQGSQTETLLVT